MIIFVEGNISAGKSTFGKLLREYLQTCGYDTEYMNEPLHLWTNFHGVNLLQKYYENTLRWGFTFQVFALLSMKEIECKAKEWSKRGKIIIVERSVRSVIDIFTKLLSSQKLLQDFEYNILLKMYDECCNNYQNNKTIIYLKTTPELCFQRLHYRKRVEEINSIDINYLKLLHTFHEETYIPKITDNSIVINGDLFTKDNIETVKMLYPPNTEFTEYITKQIDNYINKNK